MCPHLRDIDRTRHAESARERSASFGELQTTQAGVQRSAPARESSPLVEDHVVPDLRGRLPGRGASLHPSLSCLELAERRRAFPRAFRVPGPLDVSLVRAHLEGDTEMSCRTPS